MRNAVPPIDLRDLPFWDAGRLKSLEKLASADGAMLRAAADLPEKKKSTLLSLCDSKLKPAHRGEVM